MVYITLQKVININYKYFFTHKNINIVLQKKNIENYTKIGDNNHYSLHNIFIISVITLLRYNRILQHISYSFLNLIVLVKSELSMHVQWNIQIFHLFLN